MKPVTLTQMQRASLPRQGGGNSFIVKDDKPEHEEENESQHSEEASEKPTKIVLSNLPSSAHEEYLEIFFENTKKFGGESVFSVEFDKEEGTAVIEFHEPEAVQRVLSKRPITMMGQEIDVEIFVPEKPKPKCTVEVTGPPDVVSEEQLEVLEMYFYSERRSGGGEVVDITFVPEKDMALITFKTEEIAVRVVERENHFIKKQKINVQIHIPETKKSRNKQTNGETAEPAEVEEEPPKCTVKIKGVDKTGSRDTLEYYLENKKRSGGGEIDLIKSDEEEEDVLYVTFKSPEAAMRVAQREHSLENRTLKASLYVPPKPPPSYEDRVLIKGLNPSTTQDCLFNFIEAETNFTPERMYYHADQESVVMVTFQMGKEDLDFDKLEKVFRSSKLEGASLKVSRVPIPDCIIVSNLTTEVTRDTVEYYFENVRKSGGGTVKKVVMNDDDTCLVYFEDYTVIDKVLERQHTLLNQSLEMKRYQECLGRPEVDIGKIELTSRENTESLGSTEDFDCCCDPCLTVDHRSEAQAFCISCQENLCKKCFDTHKKLRFSRNHKVEDTPRKLAKSFVPQNARAVSTESCTIHQGEFIKFFCQQHSTLGCNDCMTLYHRPCDIDYIPDVCKGITKTKHYKDLLSDVKKAVRKRQTFEIKVMSSQTETERSIETAVADIEDFQVKINVKINSLKMNLLQQLKSHKSNDTQQAVEILSTNKTVLSELKTLQEALEKFETSGQDADAYITMRQTQSTLQNLRYRKELNEAEMRKYNFVQDSALRDMLSSCRSLGEISSSSHPFSV